MNSIFLFFKFLFLDQTTFRLCRHRFDDEGVEVDKIAVLLGDGGGEVTRFRDGLHFETDFIIIITQDFVNIKDPKEMLIAMQLKEYKLSQKFDFYTIKETAYRLDLNSHSVIRENTLNAEKIYRNDPKLKFLFNDK